MIKPIIKQKKGQADIVILIGILVSLMILAPVMLKIFNSIVVETIPILNESSVDAGSAMTKVSSTFTTFWDYLIVIAMFVAIITLFISAFMVDTHPIFLIMYIMMAFGLMTFSNYLTAPVTNILGMGEFATELGQIPMTSFMITNFNLILLGVIVLSGIILYGKFKGRSSDL